MCILSKFAFSRPDLDGNKLAKGMCLERKVGDREVFSSSTEGHQFFNLSRRRKS